MWGGPSFYVSRSRGFSGQQRQFRAIGTYFHREAACQGTLQFDPSGPGVSITCAWSYDQTGDMGWTAVYRD